MSNILDVHTHIHFPAYDADREAVIERARKAGVKMICVGTQSETSRAAIKLAEKYPGEIWATTGFHPNHLATAWHHDKNEQEEPEPEEFVAKRIRKIAQGDDYVVAIGEFGLDYYRLSDPEREKKLQKEVFMAHAEMGSSQQKPFMIHCRPSKGSDDAYIDALNLLSEHKTSPLGSYAPLPERIFHFYVGSLEMTKKLVAAGAYFTFGGVITFTRDYDEIIRYIPLDRIFLETDAPYVAPEPYRGKRNEPAFIVETAKRMAEIKGVDYEFLVDRIAKNALTVFKITV